MEEKNELDAKLKRPLSPPENYEQTPSKKVRLNFNPKEFRKQIKSEQKLQALQNFLQLIEENSEQDCIASYLKHGGTVLDLVQTTEHELSVSPVLVFEIVNKVLLRISAKLNQFQKGAHDSCRYILNNYITLINKMLGLSSTSKERLVCLKLLTTIVTFSVLLAKDVLLHVNFNPTNLEILTKGGDVRSAFIHFIAAYLIGGHFPTLSVLLEKKHLITSIINKLQYDNVDVVVLVLTAMKSHILENTFVSKTVKMKTFSTPVVKNIVNLYNWKGPAALAEPKKKNNKVFTVNEIDKSKVSEAVHGFLLVLCTSHKFGVIFKDYTMGANRKNNLVFTVLDSLERPWEHSYAGELVVKICNSCPDLTKTMWSNLKPFLEPRWTVKWVNSMKFASRLLDEIQPECLNYCVTHLDVHQMGQVITNMIAPPTIIKIILPDSRFEQPAIKHQVVILLLKMSETLEDYMEKSKTWFRIDYTIFNQIISNHIQRNFPDANLILSEWETPDDETPIWERLDTSVALLNQYKKISPKLLDDLNIDINETLTKLQNLLPETQSSRIQIKIADFFLDLEPRSFLPKSQLFGVVLKLGLEYYYETKSQSVLSVLHRLFKNSGVFDGFYLDIDLWIDGILNLKNYDASIANFLLELIKYADSGAADYNKKIFELKNENFGILLLALADYSSNYEITSPVRNYLNFVILGLFHLQTDLGHFRDAISNLSFLSENLHDYIQSWTNHKSTIFIKCKGKLLNHFHKFSLEFLEGNMEDYNLQLYPNVTSNLLQAQMFYLISLKTSGELKTKHLTNCNKFIDHLLTLNVLNQDCYVKTILGNSAILTNFSVFDSDSLLTKFVTEIISKIPPEPLEPYLVSYRAKVVATLLKVFKKPQKYSKSNISIETLRTLNIEYQQCYKLLEKFTLLPENIAFHRVASYCIHRMSELASKDYELKPLSSEVVACLSQLLLQLITEQTPNINVFCASLLNYLMVFPHNLQAINFKLFNGLVSMSEFHKDNLLLCEFLLDRNPEFVTEFENNLDEICSKRSFLLSLLNVVITQNDEILETIYKKSESHFIKALQKPHKAGQHFQNCYKSVGVLIEKFMDPGNYGGQVLKFESVELFHVYLLKKIFDKVEKSQKKLTNIILTFIHQIISLLKCKNTDSLGDIAKIILSFVKENKDLDLSHLGTNETFRTFSKLCLKFGVEGDVVLLEILTELVQFCVGEDEAKTILEMMLSHSQFLDVILGDSPKEEMMSLWKVLCEKWPQFMKRSHIPVLLSAYGATRAESTILSLLKMYESVPTQTKFFDFKPFIWGRAAASLYSVRSDLQQVLWRQPKMADVLNNLYQETVLSTITNPLAPESYDLNYFLPLFGHLLSPENPVTTYRFTKSGALALTLLGFLGDKTQRLATCHVLQRFYFHLEAKQTGKDHELWLRFIEAVCKGVAVFEDIKVNNFVAVFLAKTSLILTQPYHIMYLPLSQYLVAKDILDFSTIPELYTLLHSPNVDYKEHRNFILELIKDGLQTEKDFTTFLRSMGFKLISELCSSTVCDLATKILILNIFERCCELSFGVKVLCGNLSFLAQIFGLIMANSRESSIVLRLLRILRQIINVDKDKHRNFIVYLNLIVLSDNDRNFRCVKDSNGIEIFYEILWAIANRFPNFLTKDNMEKLLQNTDDKFCNYLVQYGSQFVKEADLCHYNSNLRHIFYNKLKCN